MPIAALSAADAEPLDPQAAADPLALTPLRAHYLKKELLRRAVAAELTALATPDALALLGPPFKPLPGASGSGLSLPILSFIFHQLVLTFPLLRSAPPSFYSDKIQVFVDDLLSKNLSSTDDRDEETKRRRLSLRLQRYFVLLLSSALGTYPPEQVVRLSAADTQRLAESEARAAAAARGQISLSYLDVNIIAVRLNMHRSLVSRKTHEFFLVRTRRGANADATQVLVARRYGDFARLAETLRAQFPALHVPHPPGKDRSQGQGRYVEDDVSESSHSSSPSSRTSMDEPDSVPLSREKNRLTLRAYLRSLLAHHELAESDAMRWFLTADPTELSPQEARDAAAREALDQARQDEAQRFAAETTARVEALQAHLAEFKKDLARPDGLSRLFGTIKEVPEIDQLPTSYRAVISWARISAASTLFHLFRRGDTSSELLAKVKHVHHLMPYRLLKGILKISNPVAMIRAWLDLFLAQPFGQKSLVQRMFLSGIGEEIKELVATQQALEAKIGDTGLTSRLTAYIKLEPGEQDEVRKLGQQPGWDLLSAILISPHCGPPLSAEQTRRLTVSANAYAHHTHTPSRRKSQETAPPQEAVLYGDLHALLLSILRAKDKEEMLSLLSEGVTANLIKDLVTIFYAPLAQVYKAADIGDSLGDLQAFITDLITTVEALDQPNSNHGGMGAPIQHTVQAFIDLVARHEQAFYSFVHQVHSRGAGLFDNLMDWIQRIINLVRGPGDEDLPSSTEHAKTTHGGGLGRMDLEVLLPAGKAQRALIFSETDKLVDHAYRVKLVRQSKVRRKLVRQRIAHAADHLLTPADEWNSADDAAFSGEVMRHLGFGGAARDEVVEATLDVANESDAESEPDSDDEEREHPSGTDAWGNHVPFPRPDVSAGPPPPKLEAIPELLPTFVALLETHLQDASLPPPPPVPEAEGWSLFSGVGSTLSSGLAGVGSGLYGMGSGLVKLGSWSGEPTQPNSKDPHTHH